MNRTAVSTLIAMILGGNLLCGLFGEPFFRSLQAQHPGFQQGSRQGPGHPESPVRGYFQPVKLAGPEGSTISFSTDNRFVESGPMPSMFGLMIGPDYRIKLSNIPFHPGREVFPTVKIIGRTYPPKGLEYEFPIPIEITLEDIELALDGKFVTRVIYLENSGNALPIRGDAVSPTTHIHGGDPIDIAANFGQPIAIVRLGGRIPNFAGGDMSFFFNCPPWLSFVQSEEGIYSVTLFQNTPQNMPYRSMPHQSVVYGTQPNSTVPPASPYAFSPAPPGQVSAPSQVFVPPAALPALKTASARQEWHGGGWMVPDTSEASVPFQPSFSQPQSYTY